MKFRMLSGPKNQPAVMRFAGVCKAAALAAFLSFPPSSAAKPQELAISGFGPSAEQKFTRPYPIKRFTPYRISFEARKCGAGTTGKTICAGLVGYNVDLDLKDGWTAYSDVVMSSSDGEPVAQVPLRFSLWQVSGEAAVRNWRVVEQQAVYANDGTMELGEGEALAGSRYIFKDKPGSGHHNHSRALWAWRGALKLNTDRYVLGDGAEIIWRHRLAGRKFLSGEVILPVRYYGEGTVRIEVSSDGDSWTAAGCVMQVKHDARFRIKPELFPADEIYVRVRGECAKGVQLGGYGFSADVDGEKRFVSGSTVYADVGETVVAPELTVPEYYRTDYGELLPGSSPSLALWRAESGWKVPRDRAVPSMKAAGITMSMAANETEAVQLVLTPDEDMTDVSVSVDIPRLSAEVCKVSYVRVDLPSDGTTLQLTYPDPLPPLKRPISLKGNENQPFWIRVKADKGCPKGVYDGSVTVRGERAGGDGRREKIELEIPLKVEVFGFSLPDRMTCRSLVGFFPAFVDRYHGLKKREDRLRMYDRYMEMYSRYRLSANGGATGGLRNWHPVWDGDEPRFDWTEWDEGMRKGFERYHFNAMRIPNGLGVGGGDAQRRRAPEIGGVRPDDPRYEIRLAKLLKGVQDHLEENGWLDRVYAYCFDEPPENDDSFVMDGFAKLVKYAPKLRRFITSPCRSDLLGGPQTWCMMAPDFDNPLVRQRKLLGEEFWLYVCTEPRAPYATVFIDHQAVELRALLWQSWAEDVKGVLFWTANLWTTEAVYPDRSRPQNPYVDAQSWSPAAAPWGNGDGRIFYPPESVFEDVGRADSKLRPGPNFDDPAGSVRGEMLRDGIEDYEYFAILKKLDPGNRLLRVPPSVSISLKNFNKSPAGIESHRILLAREIERLTSRGF